MNKPNEEIQLFDLKKDPYEETNLAAEYPEIVGSIKDKINASWQN